MSGWGIALLVVLIWLLVAALVKIDRLQERSRLAQTWDHAACTIGLMEAISKAHDADLLRRAADRWESPDEQGNLRILAREKYSPGGPSMPALWLRQQADLIQIDSHSAADATPERRVGDA